MGLSVYLYDKETEEDIFCFNTTHNLGKMASEAGIYLSLWRAEENGIQTAGQLIKPLKSGLEKMKADPAYFQKFDSPNGWGLYVHFVPLLEDLLRACEENPEAKVWTSR